MLRTADIRLVAYGTLVPGRANHHQLADLWGRWLTGTVRGRFVPEGWGAKLGYPALILDPSASPVEVHVFESADLPDHWQRLDVFEGDEYRRVVVQVETAEGRVDGWVYVAARCR